MTRQVTESRILSPLKCTLDQFDELVEEIIDQFPKNVSPMSSMDKVGVTVTLERGNEVLMFDGIEEFKSFKGLPDSVKNLRIYFSNPYHVHRVLIRYKNGLFRGNYVNVEGPNLPWCVGIIELVKSFGSDKKNLSGYFQTPAAFGLLAGLMQLICWFFIEQKLNWVQNASLIALAVISGTIVFSSAFPRNLIVAHKQDSWLKRNDAETKLAIAFIGLLITVIKLFF